MTGLRVLVTGSAGQLARAIRLTWDRHQLFMPEENALDLGDPGSIASAFEACRPEVVINAGAFTQVDRCEELPDLARTINGEAVGWLARACEAGGALLVQISTDYVFDGTGTRPYRETDPVNPLSAYGRSKLLGEEAARRAPAHLILRTSWLYDAWGRNFYLTMKNAAAQGRSLKVVDDQRGCPTTCRALARQVQAAVEEGWRGLVHATCSGETSWHGFAAEIFRQCGLAADLRPCATSEYPLPAPRPAYSVLDGSRRKALGTDVMPSWQEALAEVVAQPLEHRNPNG